MSDLKQSEVYEDEELQEKVQKINSAITVWDNGSIWVDEYCSVTFSELVAIAELLKKEGRV